MSSVIRPATNADVDGVVDVIRTVYDEYRFTWEPEGYHADLYDIETHYDGVTDRFYVVELEGKVAGTVALETFDRLPGMVGELGEQGGLIRAMGCDCSLERLYVHPSARKHGLGTLLFQHVVHIAKWDGRKAMEIWSDKKFADAHRLYERVGAKVIGDRVCYDPDNSPEWGLVLNLT